ncbi:hypothetical protein [Pelotomaculum propionicicum]|uniref:Uncharacterized protein n=1 Tax=Pelotomaculum propionicicum TaxID=258475 RepID=A0A4Y7RXN5_9FIRM|nr:hypothetical protein [Pelotomaculum propionicicum]NLI12747.1 hypothetical protein [Peptococcaceae bacterium]TEB13479.1 hypothetical protein Pmgp_00373 [Pelotomaculum propionicicum]
MKRYLIFLFALLLLLSAACPALAGSVTNTSVNWKITPDGDDAALEAVWVGKPDDQGNVYLPVPPGKATWEKTEIKDGILSSEKPSDFLSEGNKVHRWQVKPSGEETTLKVIYKLPKLFAPKESEGSSEGGPTQRGDIRNIKFSFENTLPNGISSYNLTVVLPQGYEVFRVVSPKKYSLTQKDGISQLSVSLKGKDGSFGILPGKTSDLEFDYVKTGKGLGPLWVGIIALSAIFLYFRRDVLKPGAGGKQ